MADYIRPTPRNPILGLLSDALTGGVEWMRSPQRAQQMQGLGGLLAETGIPATVERMSYGEPLTKGRGMTTRLRPEAEAALMTLGPEAVPIGRGAMAAVRATKGLPVGAATVYHGSPYRFQRFDPTKIGSGEGAQSYGYGHYVAESPEVAAQYRKQLAPGVIRTVDDVAFDSSNPQHMAASYMEMFSKRGKSPEQIAQMLSEGGHNEAAQIVLRGDKLGQIGEQARGALYTIDLPDPAIARMLDWDKPLSQQYSIAERMKNALTGPESPLSPVRRFEAKDWLTDPVRMRNLHPQSIVDLKDPQIVEQLRQAGIPGIRYLDQGSRSNFRVQNTYKGEPYGEPVSFMTEKQARDYAAEQMEKGFGTNILPGTSNFVVFPGEEDLLRILNVEGGLLGP